MGNLARTEKERDRIYSLSKEELLLEMAKYSSYWLEEYDEGLEYNELQNIYKNKLIELGLLFKAP